LLGEVVHANNLFSEEMYKQCTRLFP
jgi:hypothetical protein